MKLVQSILTKNPCYTAGRKITVKGLMLHSVGCPQPKASVFINSWNSPSYDSACVHGFIDAHVIIGTRLEKPSKINGFALLSPSFFMPERGERNHHTSTYIAGQQYESLIAIKATIPSFGDGFEGPKSL